MRLTLTDHVVRALRRHPRARRDKTFLVLAVCQGMGYNVSLSEVESMSDLPDAGSIVRIGARIQNNGRFRPTGRE